MQSQLIELQFYSLVQARVVEGALQGRGVRDSIAFKGCTLAPRLVIVILSAHPC
jgi:hypothetical protein